MRACRLRRDSAAAITAIVAVGSLALAGCRSGDGRTIDPMPEEPLFSRLWPNEDGNSWSFDYQRHFATEPMIAELEGLEDLAPEEIDYLDLERRLTGDLPAAGETDAIGTPTLRFDGTVASLDGPKQNLTSDLAPIAKSDPSGEAIEAAHSREVSPLIARIYAARPDLRERMRTLGYVPRGYDKTAAVAATFPPFSLHDSKFEKQEAWIGLYGDLRADSSYTIVKEPLRAGTTFRHQLVPGLDDDIWVYGWILGERSFGSLDVIGVVYFLDFGESGYVNDSGEEVLTFRSYSISKLYLAPDIGPVYQRTIDFLTPPIPELNIDIGVLFSEVSLVDFELR